MAFVRIEQRNARLASLVKLETVNGRDGPVSKGTVTVISNIRRSSSSDETTAIQWTLWGKLAENAGEYLGKGSRVNVVGRVQNNTYQNGQGETVYAMTFTCEELDYLDSKGESEARKARDEGSAAPADTPPVAPTSAKGPGRAKFLGKHGKGAKATAAAPAADDDIPF